MDLACNILNEDNRNPELRNYDHAGVDQMTWRPTDPMEYIEPRTTNDPVGSLRRAAGTTLAQAQCTARSN